MDRYAVADAEPAAPQRPSAPPPPEARRPAGAPTTNSAASRTDAIRGQWLPIHKVFKGYKVEGRFDPSTHEIQLVSEPWSNRFFSSPTAAAEAVVEKYSPGRQSVNTNGRIFWIVTQTGKDLRSIIGER